MVFTVYAVFAAEHTPLSCSTPLRMRPLHEHERVHETSTRVEPKVRIRRFTPRKAGKTLRYSSLASCHIDANVISALRRSAIACNRSSQDFERANPGAPPAASDDLLNAYTKLVEALSQTIQRDWQRTSDKTALENAVNAIG